MPMRSAALLCLLLSTAACAQTAVQRPTVSPHNRIFEIRPANDDPNAVTPEQIARVNEALAAKGNTEAAYQLGFAFSQGVGEPVDFAKAEHWFAIGATSPERKAYLAEFYRDGEFLPKDEEKAAKWFHLAGRPGDLFQLVQLYEHSAAPRAAEAAAVCRELLTMTGAPEVRRAQMELGNFVLDGVYSAGDDAASHALNLEWARIIAQELLGQQEYNIAVAYDANVDGMPQDKAMWLRFVRRAAAYNVDLAQSFYGQAILKREIPDASLFEGYAWVRLSSDKQHGLRSTVRTLEGQMTSDQKQQADSLFEGLVQTRLRDGAYYSAGDPLREPAAEVLAAMPAEDPDVQLRQAFALEQSHVPADYTRAMDLYRRVRDRRGIDIKLLLAKQYRDGSNGVSRDERLARYWQTSAERGPEAARAILQ